MIAAGIPDAAWNRAKLATASPNPPLRANGASSATTWMTRTRRPSGSASAGGAGAAAFTDFADSVIVVLSCATGGEFMQAR